MGPEDGQSSGGVVWRAQRVADADADAYSQVQQVVLPFTGSNGLAWGRRVGMYLQDSELHRGQDEE